MSQIKEITWNVQSGGKGDGPWKNESRGSLQVLNEFVTGPDLHMARVKTFPVLHYKEHLT